MKRYLALISLLVLTLFGLTWFMQVSIVHACLPPTPMPDETPIYYSLEDHVQAADYVFVGTIMSLVDGVAEIEVEQYLKGEGSTIVLVSGLSTSTCGVSLDRRYLFITNDYVNGIMQNFALSWYDTHAWNASDETIERVQALTNQSIAPYPMPLTQQITRAVSDEKAIWAILAVVLVGIIVSGFTMLRLRRDGRKSKAKRG